ncbi:MAG: exosortase/archaeosortase family protein [Verrucomicrobiaceae bacterium]|nr:exosortase/archaeosortase family protein [Verrucomicrobiaceae bacterium]
MPIAHAIVPVLLWLWLFWHLHFTWSLTEQYNYGWAVPFLAAFLFYQRWPARPPADRPGNSRAATFAGWFILLALLPLRVVEEANPDWRLLSWVFALLVVAFSLLALLRLGGVSWARHFAFPVCFPLVAVPWPVQFENAVVHALTRAVAYIAVEAAGWLGIAAFQVGNVIQLASGFVGVDEACSGVKTLQASLMVSLFLGELLMLRAGRRVALLGLGCAWVLACNVVRATTLVIISARSGIPAMEQWHDFIGTAVLVLGMGGLFGAAFLLSEKREALSRGEPGTASLPAAPIQIALAVLWLGAVFGATELWYRFHERQLLTHAGWQARWPEELGAKEAPIADAAADILRYNHASSAAWMSPEGGRWWGFFARWEPGRAALQLVRSHSPEICLPAVGRTFRGELAPVTLATPARPLGFRVYEFEQGGQPLFVFVCIQEDKSAGAGAESRALEWSARGRFLAAWRGERNLGQRLLEIAVVGLPDFSSARAALGESLSVIVQPTG